MSKSLGNVLDPFELVNRYGVDYLRYFLVSDIPFGNDGDFNDNSFITRINSDLANDIGNLYQRVLTFIAKNCESKIPSPQSKESWLSDDEALISMIKDLLPQMRQAVTQQNLRQYSEYIVTLSSAGNKYIDTHAPWTLKKNGDTGRLHTVLYVLAELLRQLGDHLSRIYKY